MKLTFFLVLPLGISGKVVTSVDFNCNYNRGDQMRPLVST